MIVSASRRTDIPCYYAQWFMNRIRAGQLLTRNPMNHTQLSRISLSPEVVDCIVFWTKDPAPMLPYLDELDSRGYMYYFQFTLTPYGRDIEPGLRPKADIEQTFIALSNRIAKERVVWRYDPIILNTTMDIGYHVDALEYMCEKLSPYTDTITISFVDCYAKIKTPLVREISEFEMTELSKAIGTMAKAHGLEAVACCENSSFASNGIAPSNCIDRHRVERICGYSLQIKKDPNQRKGCGCCQSIDVGAYNTCMNGCVYCYANNRAFATKSWNILHDSTNELLTSELLVGAVSTADKIVVKNLKSNKITQLRLL